MTAKQIFAIVLSLFMIPAAPSVSAGEAQQNPEKVRMAYRINVAGRQRMLSQRISNAACLVQLGVDTAFYQKMAAQGAAQFAEVLDGLIEGNAELQAESDQATVIQLKKVQARWDAFLPVVTQVAAGTGDMQMLTDLHAQNVPLLKQMNLAVAALESAASDGTAMSDLATALNVAGRQRMLSQKAAKELCMISAGINPEADRAALRATVEEFESTLQDLRMGNPARGIVAAPDWKIDAQLEVVEGLWFEMAPMIQTALAGAEVDLSDVGYASFLAEAVLKEMNTAVTMYEKL